VITTSMSNITSSTATCGGNVTATGGATVTARGVCWSTSHNPTTANAHTTNGAGNGIFSSYVTGLVAGTTYYIRSYATNSAGTSYGSQLSFNTLANLPVITTTSATSITSSTAISGGNITSDGGGTITARGVCWSTTQNPVASDNHTSDGAGTGSFTSSITNLIANTTYYVRAYATNAVGTSYGSQISFTTSDISIGSIYAGGIVFYIDGTGEHGLVCAATDQSTGATWGCSATAIMGTSTVLNTGQLNTDLIVAGCYTSGIAARLCHDLTLNTYSDWFLPSKDELDLMYVNLKTQNIGNFANANYWSSSEYEGSEANTVWYKSFVNGGYGGNSKNWTFYVRAVRSF
jgi:hypothetical protein